jgi:predicted metal-dependent peptidase
MSNPSTWQMSFDEKQEISIQLEQFHKIFDIFWGLADVSFVSAEHRVKTACVNFPKNRKCYIIISHPFWESLNSDSRLFIILHECLHVLLDHGMRNARNIPEATLELINIAQDITINEMIQKLFGFPRGLLQNWENYCWIDTCFDKPEEIEKNRSFMYYLSKLLENALPQNVSCIDDHLDGDNSGDEIGSEEGSEGGRITNIDDLAKTLGQYLTEGELQQLINSVSNVTGEGGNDYSPFNIILKSLAPAKINFTEMVKNLKRSARAKYDREIDSFSRTSRRLDGCSMILPSRVDGNPNKNKLITALFFDVSGSCLNYFNVFNSVRVAFEAEKDLFDIRTYIFDTEVTKISPKDTLGIGGGTHFHILENECKEIAKTEGRYPDCVVVITDGYGNAVQPKYPKRWIWLLTPNAGYSYIPSSSKSLPIVQVTF